jgi:hypothetical protein
MTGAAVVAACAAVMCPLHANEQIGFVMRAEIQSVVADIKQSAGLLRRHL